jgi:enterochelin esterase-like enzyme
MSAGQLKRIRIGLGSLVVVLCSWALGSALSIAAEPHEDASASSVELTNIEAILRLAGASPTTLARLKEELGHASAAELAEYADYVRRQSPAGLARTVQLMGYDDPYVLTPESKPQPGVPKGKRFEFALESSSIFPGTTREISVYIPAEYTAEQPACVYVALDAFGEAPVVFDNLIYQHAMPVTIAIGIASGEVRSDQAPEDPRFNRSFEFDGLNGNLARFLLDEVFPEVERRKTPDGLPIRLSHDSNDRAAGGISTGGIGSFTLAWERPDAFRRVFTGSGTFVGMRGGDRYPVLVRKTEPKPIRVFMQDGSHDDLPDFLDEVGDWWIGNQALERALEFAGYQVNHVWGEGAAVASKAVSCFLTPCATCGGTGRSRSQLGSRRMCFSRRSCCPARRGSPSRIRIGRRASC